MFLSQKPGTFWPVETILNVTRYGSYRTLSVWSFRRRCVAALFGWYLVLVPAIYGQESSSAPVLENAPSGWRRLSFGGRLNGYPFNLLNNKDVSVSPANTTQSWAITTSNNYLKIAFGPSLEFRLTRKFTLCGEFLYHRVNYTKTATVTDGSDTTGITEQTRATFSDAPVMLRYKNLSEKGLRSKLILRAVAPCGTFHISKQAIKRIIRTGPRPPTTRPR